MTTNINYELDDDLFVPTGFLFERNGEYDLVVTMNYADNLWSAVLNDFTIVDSQPMTTTHSALDLGDIEAVWVNRQVGIYGDNYMVFDNYSVTAEPYPFWLDAVERLGRRTTGTSPECADELRKTLTQGLAQRWEKRAGKPIILSGSITRCANAVAAWCAKRSPFRRSSSA